MPRVDCRVGGAERGGTDDAQRRTPRHDGLQGGIGGRRCRGGNDIDRYLVDGVSDVAIVGETSVGRGHVGVVLNVMV